MKNLVCFLGFVTVLTLANSAIAGGPFSATQVGSLELGMDWEALRKQVRVPDSAAMGAAILKSGNKLKAPSWGVASAWMVSSGAIVYLRPTKDVCRRLMKQHVRHVTDCLLTFGKTTATTPYRLVDLSVTGGRGDAAFADAKTRYSGALGQAVPTSDKSVRWGAQVRNNRIRVYLYDHRPGFRLNLTLRDAYAGAISHGRRISRNRKVSYMVSGYAPPR